jgi:hypothetical protein
VIYSCGSNCYGQICQNIDVVDDQNCCYYDPIISKPLKKLGRCINQIVCAGEISFFLLGTYEPPTLYDLCTNIIKQNPELEKQCEIPISE